MKPINCERGRETASVPFVGMRKVQTIEARHFGCGNILH